MNFFEHQDRARRSSGRLTWLFLAAVLGVIAVIYVIVAVGLRSQEPDRSLFDPGLLITVGGAVGAVILIGSLIKMAMLSAGGSAVAESLGGRLVSHSTRDPAERRLVNVVEEMAIASGVPVPQVYVLDQEEGLNAFAAGHSPDDAAVAVTRGTLQALNRDELQGVIGHEFSHILNGDMRLNIRLLGLLGGIMAVAIIGRVLMRTGAFSRKKDAAGLALAGVALMVVGYIGVLAGRIIQAAISRQREYLADASAVQFTRNPGGIAGALRKIRKAVMGSVVAAPAAAEASHMFFGPISLSSIFATHPPLDDRIARIEGSAADLLAGAATAPAAATATPRDSRVSGFAGAVSSSVGTLSRKSIEASASLLATIPESLQQSVRSPLGACAINWALLLDSDPAKRSVQLAQLKEFAAPPLLAETVSMFPHLQSLDPRLRLPLVDLAVPSLRSLSPAQFKGFRQGLELLIHADQDVSLFEFCLWTVIDRRVAAASTTRSPRKQRTSMNDLRVHARTLLAAVCKAGHSDPSTASSAFEAAAPLLGGLLNTADIPDSASFSPSDLAQALSVLGHASLKTRKTLLDACSACVLFDKVVQLEEAQMLRAVAYALDLPLPPFLDEGA